MQPRLAGSSIIRFVAGLGIGDVLQLPIDANRVGFGQVVATYKREAYYVAIFERPYERAQPPGVAESINGRIALLALTFDALVHNGEWVIVGSTDPVSVTWPIYREATAPDEFVAVDHTGRIVGPLTRAEAEDLPTRKIVAPIGVQRAFQALHGVGDWHDAYESLRYQAVR